MFVTVNQEHRFTETLRAGFDCIECLEEAGLPWHRAVRKPRFVEIRMHEQHHGFSTGRLCFDEGASDPCDIRLVTDEKLLCGLGILRLEAVVGARNVHAREQYIVLRKTNVLDIS